jgi:hypothetical protein
MIGIKVKHLVVIVNIILSIVGLTVGWIEDEATILGFIIFMSVLFNICLLIVFIILNWNREL